MVKVEREVSSEMEGCEVESKVHDGIITVSYTHLTLPTIYSV